MSACNSFLAELETRGLSPRKTIDLTSGQLVRFRVQGDKPGSCNGWAVFHGTCGTFGSWRTGETFTWFDREERDLNASEKLERLRLRREALRLHTDEQARAHASAQNKAQHLWDRARFATSAHPYLRTKGVNSYGFRLLREALVIPARDADGKLHTLQFIQPDGTKRFLTGGRIKGCYCAIGRPKDVLLIAEGVATAATLHEVTGQAVAASFNCGNMEAVARALRSKFPDLRLIVVADNDLRTPGNPGLTHARAAADAVGAWLAVPDFTGCVA